MQAQNPALRLPSLMAQDKIRPADTSNRICPRRDADAGALTCVPPRSARACWALAGALLVIWMGFAGLFVSRGGGNFLTPRNCWNLSVQTPSIVAATGMALVIVTTSTCQLVRCSGSTSRPW
jgi:hypothetical protein